MSTRSVQRRISAADLDFVGYLRAPHEAKPTAIGLWTKATDVAGRCLLVPELIAAAIYPGEAAAALVVRHVLMLEESGFLLRYEHEGDELLALLHPLRADKRGAVSDYPPPPPRGVPRNPVAMEGERVSARERAEARVRAEQAEREGEWAAWRERGERSAPPRRPLLLDAPPIGCVDHPNGRRADCGPCGTARRQHDRWVAQQRYTEQLTRWEEESDADDAKPW
ncbi:hypothetical protein [Microbacterium sp. 5K110]|uniref:hypothetical protein n=1 Tax=unclassified Microbacterium TaxID=2609290 RepID=UPI001BB2497F|nr:hypothetical protein [Microbacterium sp. 5K110]